jgi:branched-chain amino acid transport system ATP-binding protein
MLAVSNLNVWFGATEVLRDVTFRVGRLEIVALLGGNGSGKSTVVNAICGLVSPRAGSIRVDEREIAGQSPDRVVRSGVAQVPQGREIFSNMTVRENLEMGAHSRGRKRHWIDDLERMLELFPVLRKKQHDLASLLSGGEQQQVAIARALMTRPKVLLMDEPTVGLSPIMVDRMIETVQGLRKLGLTILLVEQNVGVAAALADTAFVLRDGEIAFTGPARDLISNEDVLSSYLGH